MTVQFKMEKATKNTIRFQEVLASELDAPKIGTLYIPKSTLTELKWAEGMNISVEVKTSKQDEIRDAQEDFISMIEVKEPITECCICGKTFTGWGNNPHPVYSDKLYKGAKAVCCDHCNLYVVYPERVRLLSENRKDKNIHDLQD